MAPNRDNRGEVPSDERARPGILHGVTMQNVIVSLGLLMVGAALTFISTWYWFEKNAAIKAAEMATEARAKIVADQAVTDAAMRARLAELELQVNAVKQAVVPISAAFQAVLIKELTHYHTPVMDALLAKLLSKTLTEDEEKQLIAALQERTLDMGPKISNEERDSATILPFVMKRVRLASSESFSGDMRTLRVVSIPEAANDAIKQEEMRAVIGDRK